MELFLADLKWRRMTRWNTSLSSIVDYLWLFPFSGECDQSEADELLGIYQLNFGSLNRINNAALTFNGFLGQMTWQMTRKSIVRPLHLDSHLQVVRVCLIHQYRWGWLTWGFIFRWMAYSLSYIYCMYWPYLAAGFPFHVSWTGWAPPCEFLLHWRPGRGF